MKITSSIVRFMNCKWMFLFVCTFCAGTIHAQTIQTTCSSIQYVGSICDVTIPIGYSLSGTPSLPPVYSTNVSGGYKTFTFIWNVVANRTYTIKLLDEPDGGGGGSGVLDSYAVTVYNHVGSVTISGLNTVCQSSATTAFTASASNAVSYSWTLTPATAGTIASDGLVTWSSSYVGTATVGVYAYGASEDYSNSSKIVSRLPMDTFTASINAPNEVCEGQTFSIGANTSHIAATYAWYVDDSQQVIGTTQYLNVTPQYNTFYRVTVTPSTSISCLTSYSPLNLSTTHVSFFVKRQVNGLQISSGPSSVCNTGSSSQYTKTVSSADSYQWSLTPQEAGQISSEGLITWNPSFNATATVTVNAYGCMSSFVTTSVNVDVRSLPQITNTAAQLNPAAVCGNVALNFSPTSTVPGAQFSWTSSTSGNVSGVTTSGGGNVNNTLALTNSQPGTVTYSITPHNGTCIGSPEYLTINLKPIPTISTATGPTVCEGSASVIGLSSLVPNTTFNWTVLLPTDNISNGSSGSSTAQINSTLALTNHSIPGSVQYNVIATANSCMSSPVSVIASVNPIPSITNAAAQFQQTIFSGTALNFIPTSSIIGTNYSWTSSIAGSLTGVTTNGTTAITDSPQTSIFNSTATYHITPTTGSCPGSPKDLVVSVYAKPVISSSSQRVNLGEDVTLQTASGYDSYIWKNQAGATVGNSQSYATRVADTYSITVTKNGISATSAVFILGDQFTGINKNYVVENTVLQIGVLNETTVNSLTVEGRSQQIQYIDGLGRAEQVVSTEQSSLKKDIVQPIAYDLFGRQAQNYLPFVSTEGNGRFKDGAVALQNQFYSGSAANVATDARPFSETIFEPSPLNRPSKQYGPGQGWKDPNLNIDKFIEHQYLINQSSEVLLFNYDITTGLVSRANGAGGYYEAGQLRANNTIDEQGNEVIEYADKQGHTVCKKVQYGSDGNGKLYASTYYLYDDFGNLVVVLPPEAVKKIGQ